MKSSPETNLYKGFQLNLLAQNPSTWPDLQRYLEFPAHSYQKINQLSPILIEGRRVRGGRHLSGILQNEKKHSCLFWVPQYGWYSYLRPLIWNTGPQTIASTQMGRMEEEHSQKQADTACRSQALLKRAETPTACSSKLGTSMRGTGHVCHSFQRQAGRLARLTLVGLWECK